MSLVNICSFCKHEVCFIYSVVCLLQSLRKKCPVRAKWLRRSPTRQTPLYNPIMENNEIITSRILRYQSVEFENLVYKL